MSEFIKEFVKKNKPQFLKYRKYIEENDWRDKSNAGGETVKGKQKTNIQLKSEEFVIQNQLVTSILDRIKYFVKKSEGDHHLKIFKDFIKEALKTMDIHTNRADLYISTSDITNINDIDLRSEEIAFHNTLFKSISSIQDKVSELNIKEDSTETTGIAFHENRAAPLSMCNTLCELYPEIKRAVEALNIDFKSPPNNEMHINNPNPPVYNSEKHFWLQERDTLQYYVDEHKKCELGINIDGYFMNGWLYYHLNVFVTDVPEEFTNINTGEKESKDVLRNPPARDNEIYIIANYEIAKKEGKMMFLAATRRAAKTTLIASKLDHAATIGKKTLLCAGGSAKDLGQIEKNFKTSVLNKNPAFTTYNLSNDWSKKIELGIKTKSGKTIPSSTLYVVNLNSGGEKSSEVLAGFTPDEFVLDEAMKSPFLSQLEALKPALDSPHGKRCVGIISGTGGNEDLSKDAMDVLNFPEVHDILEMQWDLLERGVPKEEITWKEDRRKFGSFLPAQMSAKVGMVKVDSTLADYLGRPKSEELRKIKLKVTDWKKCNEIIKLDRLKKAGNRISYTKEVVYYPIKPSELFLSGKINPFPVEEAKAHRDYLKQTGKWDRRREVFRDSQGRIQTRISTKDLIEYPHKGGNIDAPFLIFEDIPEDKPAPYTYIGGFDDYKQDSSDSDSVSTFYVLKQDIFGDPYAKKVVASLSTKPTKHSKVHEQWQLLMEAYNLTGTAFGENEDFAIKEHLDRQHLTERYLAPSVAFTQTFNLSNNLKRAFGWTPSASKKVIFNLFIDYCNEEVLSTDENGNEVIIKGVQRIDDIILLDEIISYTENSNVDRIIAAMSAIAYAHFLFSTYQTPKRQYAQKQEDIIKHIETHKTFYSNPTQRRGHYRKR